MVGEVRATEAMLADTILADSRAWTARVCWCKCTGCTTKKQQLFFLVALS